MAYKRSRALAPLIGLALLVAAVFGTVAAGAKWSSAHWTPRLGLDLAGGTQIVLTPQLDSGQQATDANIAEAINIIRQRVNASGVSEAEVTKQGADNIVVALPGDPREQAQAIKLVSQSAQMTFRPVLYEQQSQPAAEPSPSSTPSGSPSGTKPSAPAKPSSSATTKTNSRVIPEALRKTETPSPAPTYGIPGQSNPASTADSPSDQSQITEAIGQKFLALDCSKPENVAGGTVSDPKKPLVTCAQDGAAKYILGPVELRGDQLQSASSGLNTDERGNSTGDWKVDIKFKGEAVSTYEKVTKRIVALQAPQNQMAVVLDDLVVVAPTQQSAITNGEAQITGNFTNKQAGTLSSQLKFGALPMSFKVETQQQISALLGSEQLRSGLLAGLIGLGLVALYSLFQYRGLGLVTVASLLIAATLTFGSLLILSWAQGYRLSLPGVAGMIVAIGVTADSFIVYFERVRDEVRDGRTLVSAVERGWKRARQTIIVSDIINLVAAGVLYFLAVGGVRGFAFTLGLTTIIDLLVVVLFTHPLMAVLAHTKFFGGGHPWSGFSEEQLGRPARYVGRGQVRVQQETKPVTLDKTTPEADDIEVEPARPKADVSDRPLTIAERKAAAARAARSEGGNVRGGTITADSDTETADDANRES